MQENYTVTDINFTLSVHIIMHKIYVVSMQ